MPPPKYLLWIFCISTCTLLIQYYAVRSWRISSTRGVLSPSPRVIDVQVSAKNSIIANTKLLVGSRPPDGDSGRFPHGGTFGGDVPQGSFAEWSRHGGSPRPQEPGQGIRQINHSVASSVWAPSGNGPASALQSLTFRQVSEGVRPAGYSTPWFLCLSYFMLRTVYSIVYSIVCTLQYPYILQVLCGSHTN